MAKRVLFCLVLLGLMSLSSSQVFAAIEPQEVPYPTPYAEYRVPSPTEVPGKEYSTDQDTDHAGNLDPGQTVMWVDQYNVWDGVDYCNSGTGGSGPAAPGYEADELANCRDKYLLDLIDNRVSLVVSVDNSADIYYHKSSLLGGGHGIWAYASQINADAVPTDIDGLELWGPAEKSDANMYSAVNDPEEPGTGKVSVFKYDEDTGVSTPWLMTSVLWNNIILDNGTLAKNAGLTEGQIDLDGLMTWDVNDDGSFGPGDKVVFSIKPVSDLFDGGEIWVYSYEDDTAHFLEQGGVTWNTANNVRTALGLGAQASENIDAIEALPEPATLTLVLLGGLALGRRKR
jgi:hypothetical protein